MNEYKIAVFVGSLRRNSINRRLANAVLKLGPPEFRFENVEIGDIPFYNQDDEGHLQESTKRLKNAVAGADGLVIVTPEYNRSIPGVLKNALDQGSRPKGTNSWGGKPVGILGASNGAIGTAAAQQHLRNILACLDAPTMGQPEAFIHVKEGFFDDTGGIADGGTRKFLQGWMDSYVAWVKFHTGRV
jgi:chromate reductase, NAD(P)H dehydrogenase (quinone)